MTHEYKSSILRCNAEEDGCKVRGFLNGNRDKKTLLEVIRILDEQLAKEQEYSRALLADRSALWRMSLSQAIRDAVEWAENEGGA